MSKEGYYRWCGTDGGYWLNGHTYYYDGSQMSTENGHTLQSPAKTVGHGGSWEYVGEEPAVPQKKPIVYVCEGCANDPCYLVLMKDPGSPPIGCPLDLTEVEWHRRTNG